MTFADVRKIARPNGRDETLFRVLLVAGLLLLTASWTGTAAAASSPAKADSHAAGKKPDAHSGSDAIDPIFGLPPIVVKVPERGKRIDRTIVFKADLVFDEVENDRINDSMRVAKALLPRIMDSVITGMQGKYFDDLSTPASLSDVVLQRSNIVLKPYGVVAKALRLQDLGNP